METIITSVSEYISYLESVITPADATSQVGRFTFYRGQANKSWKLSPNIYRNNLFDEETLLLTELQHICSKEFQGSRFEILVKMQHFGLPTRLLDLTTNPLVALYFACESEENKSLDGAVYLFPDLSTSWSTDPLVDLIMDYVFDYASGKAKVNLNKILCASKSKYTSVHRATPDTVEFLLDCLTVPSIAVMAAKTNPRIEAQDGAFLLCGMKVESKEIIKYPTSEENLFCSFSPVDINTESQISPKTQKLIIPTSAKNDILHQLDILGINERKLFPDLPHQIQYTVKTVERWKNGRKR